jgi:transcriptional regulator with XRE-family HTH domain
MRTRDILAANLKLLMEHHQELRTLKQLVKASGMTNGTLDRIRRAATSVGVDELKPLAEVFDLQPWQLLVEGLDPKDPPVLAQQSERERELYSRLRSVAEDLMNYGKPKT